MVPSPQSPVVVEVPAPAPSDEATAWHDEHARHHETERARTEEMISTRISQAELLLGSRIDAIGNQIADLSGRIETVAAHPTQAPEEAEAEAGEIVEVPAEVVAGEGAPGPAEEHVESRKHRRRRRL